MEYVREDKETQKKETISLNDLRYRLMGNYKDVDSVIEAINQGEKIQTNFNWYYKANA